MTDEAAPDHDASFLDGLPLSGIVRRAVARVIEAGGAAPVQTGAVLAALAEADSQGDWGRVWPSYEGGADALLAASEDAHPQDSGITWHGTPLSQDLASALRLLALMADRYEMDPVQPGAVALALAADPGSGVARRLAELSGCAHGELLERIQSDLLGTTLEDFNELTRLWAIREALGPQDPVRRTHRLARQAAALYCVWVGWLAIRAGVGGVIGAPIVAVAVLAAMIATIGSWLSVPSPRGTARQWKVELRPNYASPRFMLLLFLVGVGIAIAVSGRNRVPRLVTPTLFVLGCLLAVVLASGTFHVESLRPGAPPASPSALTGKDNFRYRALFGVPVILAGIVGLFAWYVHLGLTSLPSPSPAARLTWRGHVLFWIRGEFTSAFFGSSFGYAYWPLLVVAATLAGGYFCVLAGQLLLTRVKRKAGIWAAGSCAAGFLIVAASYISPLAPGGAGIPSSHGSLANAVLRSDEGMINHLRDRCRGFEPPRRGCPFAVARTGDGQGGILYAVALEATAGDSCAGSIVYFFDGAVFVADTTHLAPGGTPAEARLTSPHPGQFMVAWRVNPAAHVACARFGTGGTDPYVYAWNGTTMLLAAGKPPRRPATFPPGSSLHPRVPGYLAQLEYCGAIHMSADGSGAPLSCADGRPSMAADSHFRQLHLGVLDLGRHATVPDIEAAVCRDVRATSAAVASDGMELAAAERGWPFSALNLAEVCGGAHPATVTATPSTGNGWAAEQLPLGTIRAGTPAVACGSVTSCAAVGSFYDPSTAEPNSLGLGFPPELLGHGTSWLKAEPALLPGPGGLLFSVVCPSPVHCLAVGWVATAAGQPGLLLIRSGTSVTARAAPLPAGAAGASVVLFSVACATSSSCVAFGNYSRSPATGEQGMLVIQSGHRWTSITAPLPVGRRANPAVTAYSVACAAPAACAAAGNYTDASGYQQGLLLSGSGSSWTATRAPVPPDAAPNPQVTLQAIACPSASQCIAVGNYTDSSGHSEGLVESGYGSRWAPARTSLPGDASVAPGVGLDSVSCASALSCVVLGNYQDSSGNFQGLLLSRSGSSWTAARAPLPANAASAANPTFTAVACPAITRCVAVGDYSDTNGRQQGVIVSRASSSWSAAEAPVPPRSNTSPNVSLEAIACPAVFRCAVLGEYRDAAGQSQGLMLTQHG